MKQEKNKGKSADREKWNEREKTVLGMLASCEKGKKVLTTARPHVRIRVPEKTNERISSKWTSKVIKQIETGKILYRKG